ncbi:site-2 protease family protein [Serpentinicella sp. ANB-PHB4]|uniref:site-2 protease family protein n=1 Tax=Serpentinicella sp. ANB-PHB4 TaxID=3074076 RepID=UPI00285953E7|nr:site-2 protease family protein [Serpentinicella sp. ANB-PHB4]MDR5658165.1 site-2 protease family protein [Serpentinicella sp. ANB-PHB4]
MLDRIMNINRIIYILPGILLALTVHEYSHGLSAYYLGDHTAKKYGRLSLNPIKHIDPFGFFMLFIFGFGWAKPVPVNPNNFKRRKLGYFIVSISGPLSNFILAIVLTIILGVQTNFLVNPYLNQILLSAVYINVILGVFNLFPIPPLDGSKILMLLLPSKMENLFYKLERYSFIFLILLLYLGVIEKVLFPIVDFLVYSILNLTVLFI